LPLKVARSACLSPYLAQDQVIRRNLPGNQPAPAAYACRGGLSRDEVFRVVYIRTSRSSLQGFSRPARRVSEDMEHQGWLMHEQAYPVWALYRNSGRAVAFRVPAESHIGSVAVRAIADSSGLTGWLSAAPARRGFAPVHDRGRMPADTAVMIADGGRVLSDLAVLRDQGELFGPVASDPTLWRALNAVDARTRDKIATARAKTRTHVWNLTAEHHGGISAAKVADADLGKTIVVRPDASIVIAHSEKSMAARMFKG